MIFQNITEYFQKTVNIMFQKNRYMSSEKYTYNRLVIVGNGFDLGLGLRTKYEDFLFRLLSEILLKETDLKYSFVKHIHKWDNDLLYLRSSDKDFLEKLKSEIAQANDLRELINLLKPKVQNDIGPPRDFIRYNILLMHLLDQSSELNWVNIESTYFHILVKAFRRTQRESALSLNLKQIVILNREFEYLRVKLNDYILMQECKFDSRHSELYNLFNILKEPILDPVVYKRIHGIVEPMFPQKIVFLNFNYTDNIEKISNQHLKNYKSETINIHGQASEHQNSIIFGYGDDSHPVYNDLEQIEDVEHLKFIKSFKYPKSRGYYDLLDFLLSGEKFEVFILGHSCGLSDRVLLKTVFESESCIV